MEEALSALAAKGIEPERPPYSVREGGSLIASSVTQTETALSQTDRRKAAV
jgi:hypothetical protein